MAKNNDSSESKLIISSYDSIKFSKEIAKFTSRINPSKINIYNGINYSSNNIIGGASSNLRYNNKKPKILEFALCLDSTGIYNGIKDNIQAMVANLESVALQYNAKTNQINYVRVIWGQIDFKGVLNSLEVEYTMFNPNGNPVRAMVNISVLESLYSNKNQSTNAENKNSKSSTNRDTKSSSGASTENSKKSTSSDKKSTSSDKKSAPSDKRENPSKSNTNQNNANQSSKIAQSNNSSGIGSKVMPDTLKNGFNIPNVDTSGIIVGLGALSAMNSSASLWSKLVAATKKGVNYVKKKI